MADPKGLAERVSTFVQVCSPDEETLEANIFRWGFALVLLSVTSATDPNVRSEGRICIDNEEDENYTILAIDSGDRDSPGLLLNIASTITGDNPFYSLGYCIDLLTSF